MGDGLNMHRKGQRSKESPQCKLLFNCIMATQPEEQRVC